MALLSWSPQYLIGNETIDTEHQELFRLINEFHDRWQQNQAHQEIARVLNQLIAYAQTHFQHEEGIMHDAGYPELETHRDVHDTLVDTIFKLQVEFERKDLHLEMDTMKFVRAWLVDHIVHNDYRFRDFLTRAKPAEDAPPQAAE